MNLDGLYNELISALEENSAAAPQYWSIAQLKSYLNLGQIELVKKGGFNKFLLPLSPAELGAFYLPSDVLMLGQVYYLGKALDHKAAAYLDARHGGTAHMQGKIGEGMAYANNWRNETGIPIHWYYENNKIKLYPKPESDVATLSAVRGKLTGTILAGETGIVLTGAIPLDQNLVDFYYGGIYQNKDQWQITNSGRIDFIKSDGTTWSALVDHDYEIVYIPDSVSLTTIQSSEKYLRVVAAGQTAVTVPGGYVQGIGALGVKKNGVSQAPGAFTETAPSFITIPAPAADCTYEITVTRSDPALSISILYVQKPDVLINDTDLPFTDNEYWQNAIIYYAAYRALIKEGKMSQDIQKANIQMALFNDVIDSCTSVTSADVDACEFTAMPFFS